MRYLTKEWYMTMQDSGLGVCLEVDERAAEYSEALFQELWAEKLAQWLKEQEEVCELLGEAYDDENARRSFVQAQERALNKFRTRTPVQILSQVADPRLLALGFCTEEVRQSFAEFSEQCRLRTEQIWRAYWDARRAAGMEKAFTGGHSLHDSLIRSMDWEGEDLWIEFEREECEWPEIKAVCFRGAVIGKQEQNVENAWWLYDEIWRTGEGCEVHALFWQDEPFELTIQCRDTEIVWTVEPK